MGVKITYNRERVSEEFHIYDLRELRQQWEQLWRRARGGAAGGNESPSENYTPSYRNIKFNSGYAHCFRLT